ncbi:MAG: HAMP domain-containing sensor histidine kinase [Elusimicrobiota bacterium]|nr:HAMP domain-containing sensor histidine kinase [Elusimicrobiota bacterium]
MKRWSLRARLTAVLATTLSMFAVISTVAYLTHSRAEDRLGSGFADQLMVLTELPAHRNEIRRVDAFADNYLTTRDPAWLDRRAAAAREFLSTHFRIASLIRDPEELGEWQDIALDFAAHDADQNRIFQRVQSGGLSRAEAIRRAIDNEVIDRLVERMSHFGRLSFARLDAQRRAAREAALLTFAAVLGFGLFGSVAVAAAVSRIIVAPVRVLRAQASSWKLGEPWTLTMKDGPPEILELLGAMSSMAAQLNAQFERERQAGRLKSQLVSGVSHEFNNALAVIHTAHALLQENEPATAAAAPWHDMLAANIRALSTMATNLLNLGRLEAGKFSVDIQRVDAAALLRGAVARLEILATRKKLAVRLEAPETELPCAGDPDALSLVVANLFSNAVKYTHEGGTVTLGARKVPGGRVELFVADTGIGVAPEDREKIFGGYYRTEEGKREAKGFGVGLALSRMILEAHGTDLELETEQGKGSRFSFSLPGREGLAAAADLRA